ncbi:hypothetical protein HK414_17560 [Ramlibacter terrae]|uniref:Uncharacterized protein n=1 Tax=Ramlibacter terrae TaxID=2732511 RepID=A0ABX6P5M8_9BURK|nr:hypothetical protein HK414_17560 [Ramlibacter terrae]
MTNPASPQRNTSAQVPTPPPHAGRTPGAGARAERPAEGRKVKQGDSSQAGRGAKGPSACDHLPQAARDATA